jgi:hypothetical protein
MSGSSLSRFNSQLENLLNDLSDTFPDFMDIKIFREKYYLAKSANPKMIILIFLKYIYPYKEHILERNEDFFLSDSLTDNITNNKDIQNELGTDNDFILTKALNLKTLWNKMNEQHKETLWTYFRVLVVLCEKYVKEQV